MPLNEKVIWWLKNQILKHNSLCNALCNLKIFNISRHANNWNLPSFSASLKQCSNEIEEKWNTGCWCWYNSSQTNMYNINMQENSLIQDLGGGGYIVRWQSDLVYTKRIKECAYFLFVINLITWTMDFSKCGEIKNLWNHALLKMMMISAGQHRISWFNCS